MLLENQLDQIEPADNNFGGMGGTGMIRATTVGGGPMRIGGMGTPAEALKEMDVNMSVQTIGQIILVSLLLAIVSSIVGIAHVTKYEPIKILSERT
jgi:putative ABC transport system permease protein